MNITKKQAKMLADSQNIPLPKQGYEMQYDGFIIVNYSWQKHVQPYFLYGVRGRDNETDFEAWDRIIEMIGPEVPCK